MTRNAVAGLQRDRSGIVLSERCLCYRMNHGDLIKENSSMELFYGVCNIQLQRAAQTVVNIESAMHIDHEIRLFFGFP